MDVELDWFQLTVSDDLVKTDLELLCLRCGTHLCDAEAGDTLQVLMNVATEHLDVCPWGRLAPVKD